MKRFLSILFVVFFCGNSIGQVKKTQPYYFDIINGPYLFVSHMPYDAVLMTGARLGREFTDRFNTNIEYVVGQQEDDQNTLGMTHNVNVQFNYYINASENKFRAYFFAGGGFMEFKSFSKDVYGIQYNIGVGTNFKLINNLYGIIESRYFNLGLMDLGGAHELAVFWGMRFLF